VWNKGLNWREVKTWKWFVAVALFLVILVELSFFVFDHHYPQRTPASFQSAQSGPRV